MSIEKVAKIAGVSPATVSRVLNGQQIVKPATRDKVLAAIRECDYQPNLLARQLRTARSRMLLVLVSNITNPFCSLVVRGIEEEAERHGYHILLCNSESNPTRESAYLKLLSGKVVDGVITMDAVSCLPGLTAMIGDFPWVQCGEGDPEFRASSVTIDNHQAAFAGVRLLADKGRRRIALINSDMRYLYSQQREQGYHRALADFGLGYHRVEYVDGLEYAAGAQAMARLLTDEQPPDAVFAISDVVAGGAMSTLHQRGLRIPQDVAIIGFDGVPFGAITTPPLSTIEQPMHQFGIRSVQLLLAKIKDPQLAPSNEVLNWRLVERGTT
ncbi:MULTISPECIES: LacI family DNA-binding transcriptional regulator [Gammaproteobacteria]|uniref:LacI family DNA-binding transcriptional regulator n=1 Tax=Gammaproteobacteria TaxID=1236 RepID=UPI0021657E1C|nr:MULTISPECIES: LacI family DNA-binding transcriptional regulator [Gammaproteobacteria]MCS3406215.1 LacI family transcriptional regulator [Serratia sp. AKBS12]MDH4429579.1 LacI family DNA-binding transcriptional regulator [Pseudomonas shirazica]HEI8868979.1 LacI family DNA-binding transcriptional regulator [Serratia odorifera]